MIQRASKFILSPQRDRQDLGRGRLQGFDSHLANFLTGPSMGRDLKSLRNSERICSRLCVLKQRARKPIIKK